MIRVKNTLSKVIVFAVLFCENNKRNIMPDDIKIMYI